MHGKSPWGRITGLFEAHGLCSYRNWYDYRSVFDAQCSEDFKDSYLDFAEGPTHYTQHRDVDLLMAAAGEFAIDSSDGGALYQTHIVAPDTPNFYGVIQVSYGSIERQQVTSPSTAGRQKRQERPGRPAVKQNNT